MKFHTKFLVLFWLSSSRRLAAGFQGPLFHCHHQQMRWASSLHVYREDGSQTLVTHQELDHDYVVPSCSTTADDGDGATSSESTTGIHPAHKRCEWTGAAYGQAFMVKTSTNHPAMQREIETVAKVQEHAEDDDDVVVHIYDHNLSQQGQGQEHRDAVIVMEKGKQDLLSYLNENYNAETWACANGMAAQITRSLVASLKAIHAAGLVWTDAKLANFVVMEDDENTIKAIDLESCVPPGTHPHKFTPSTCPPEMTPVLLAFLSLMTQGGDDSESHVTIPRHSTDYSFDIWSLGIIVFTLVTKQTFYPQSNVDFEYLTHSLHQIRQTDIDHDTRVLSVPFQDNDDKRRGIHVDPLARDFILSCLRVNAVERPTIHDLANHPFIASETQAKFNTVATGAEEQPPYAGPPMPQDTFEFSTANYGGSDGVTLEPDHLAAYTKQFGDAHQHYSR